MSGWQKWLRFCRDSVILVGQPDSQQFLGFLEALAEGARQNRGLNRVAGAKAVVHTLKFNATKLVLKDLGEQLAGPIVSSWVRAEKWHGKPTREALPLPLFSVPVRARSIVGALEDRFLVGCFLHGLVQPALFGHSACRLVFRANLGRHDPWLGLAGQD